MKKHLVALLLAVLFMLSTSFVWAADETGTDALSVSHFSTDQLLEKLNETGVLGFDDATFYACLIELSQRTNELDDIILKNAIANLDVPFDYGYGMLELYLKKHDYSVTDTDFVTYLSSGLINDGLKNLLINCFSEELLASTTTKTVLLNIYNSTNDETIAYRCLKTLAKADLEIALPLCISIYHNAENEMASKVNAAVDIMSSIYRSNSRSVVDPTMPALEDFLSGVRAIYLNLDSEEVRCSILNGLNSIPDEIAIETAEALKALTPVVYASLAQGYAVYRDGVTSLGVEINWHGAIVASGIGTSGIYAQATGVDETTEIVNYNAFLGDGTFKGYYQPSSITTYTNTQRSAVVGTANWLASLHIPYVALNCIIYASVDNAQDYYYPTDILCIRCDGFVEYCFERNGIRICGPAIGSAWDISSNTAAAELAHSGVALVTPKKQAEDHMILVTF